MMKIKYKIGLLVLFTLMTVCAAAEDGTGTYGSYTPYSIFGLGDISRDGTAFNRSMGGVGIATRNRRFINYLNPAAVSARDTLAFMADFGVEEKNIVFRQGNMKSAHNTFNMYNLIMSFPIWRSSAFLVGITPYSDVGYDFSSHETDPSIIGEVGNIDYNSYGNGSIYQAFVGAGATFWKRLSVGAQFIYYFGRQERVTNVIFENSSYRSVNSGRVMNMSACTGKFGIQYDFVLPKDITVTLGATYKMKTKIGGQLGSYKYAVQSSVVDTVAVNNAMLANNPAHIAGEWGVGIAVKGGERWMAEVNYLRSDWRKCGFNSGNGFTVNEDLANNRGMSATVSQSVRAGAEWVPNRNDIRYYMRRVAYRAGVYFDQAYYKMDGNNVYSYGISLGVTLPVVKWYNGLSLGVDFGRKASTRNNMVRETYCNFVIGFNIHDIWFQKPRYN
ncbi:MAG: hypothetical protein ACI3ZQ_04435 [Candidatus Cryptobacteroides sp.]